MHDRSKKQALWRLAAATALVAMACAAPTWAAEAPGEVAEDTGQSDSNAAAEAFFENRIRPLLADACWECHGEYAEESELRLDSLGAMLKGGLRGPAIVPGDAEGSLLIRVVNHGETLRMPEADKLPLEEIQALTKWVADGAHWPDAEPFTPDAPEEDGGPVFTEEQKNFWAFQSPRLATAPEVADPDWASEELDRFVLAKLESEGLGPADPAPRHVLLRRASFDLTGLPPTPQDVAAFEADGDPDAFRRQVDRLLASPRYGERWGRHWLDVARYADSNGLDENIAFEHIYKYRDWVVRAFNSDMPYPQFVTEQLAGDLIPQAEEESAEDYIERVKAVGFLSVGPKMVADDDQMKKKMDVIDEQLNTVGQTFLGMTIGCARCHDHKFDPIPARDYYSLAGIFGSTRTLENLRVVAPIAKWELKPTGYDEAAAEYHANLDAARAESDAIMATGTADFWTTHATRTSEYLLEAVRLGAFGPAIDAAADVVIPIASRGDDEETEDQQLRDGLDFEVAEAGRYRLYVRYAHPNGREFEVRLDEQTLPGKLGGVATGGRRPEHLRWFAGPAVELAAGAHRVSASVGNVAVEQLAWVREAPGGLPPRGDGIPDVETSVAATGLHATLLGQWAAFVRNQQDSDAKTWTDLRAAQALVRQIGAPQPLLRQAAAAAAELLARPDDAREAEFAGALFAEGGPFTRFPGLENELPAEVRPRWDELQTQIAELEANAPQLEVVMAARDDEPLDYPVMIRGDYLSPGEPAPRGFLRIIEGEDAPPLKTDGSGRLELAEWMTQDDHPLTSRVIVNRVWRWRFGVGIVPTVDNFGRLGERPTHPELLDALAVRFASDDAWSLKRLHLRMLSSATYQMDSTYSETAAATDPANTLLWRYPARRLEAEAIRDATLAVSNSLDLEMYGSLHDMDDGAYVTGTASKTHNYTKPRRTIYLPIFRSAVYDMLTIFDFPDPAVSVGDRKTSIVAPQSLFQMNSPFVEQAAERLADRALSNFSNLEYRVAFLFRQLYSRSPSPDEVRSVAEYSKALTDEYRGVGVEHPERLAWVSVCRGLLAAAEFTYLD